jgi:hypothetical protein
MRPEESRVLSVGERRTGGVAQGGDEGMMYHFSGKKKIA